MNLNLLAYCIFLAIVVYIIVVIGRICYRNGNVYVLSLMPGHEDLCIRINRMLLIGYYLINIGYAATTLIRWRTITTYAQLVDMTASALAIIICMLAVLHYLNIYILTKYIQKLI